MHLFVVSIVANGTPEGTVLHNQSRVIAHNEGEARKAATTAFIGTDPDAIVTSVLVDDIGPCQFVRRGEKS